MKVKNESEVARSCPTLSDPVDCSLPGSSIHGFSKQEYWSELTLSSHLITVESTFKYHVLALLGSCSGVGMPQIKSLEPLSLNIEFRFYRMCVMTAVLHV